MDKPPGALGPCTKRSGVPGQRRLNTLGVPGWMPQWLTQCPVPQNRPSATQLLYIIVSPTTPLRSMAGYFQHALTGFDWENMT